MQLLISNGAEVNSLDSSGNTPLHKICSHPKGGTPELSSCASLLLSFGVNVNTVNADGNTALHLAVLNGHEGVVEVITEHGECDVGIMDGKGQNALHLSAVVGELGCMQIIVLKGQQGLVSKGKGEEESRGVEDQQQQAQQEEVKMEEVRQSEERSDELATLSLVKKLSPSFFCNHRIASFS